MLRSRFFGLLLVSGGLSCLILAIGVKESSVFRLEGNSSRAVIADKGVVGFICNACVQFCKCLSLTTERAASMGYVWGVRILRVCWGDILLARVVSRCSVLGVIAQSVFEDRFLGL